MPLMLVTFWVLKLLTSSEVNALQRLNMSLMSVTFWVLKLLRSSEVNAPQRLNMPPMLVTFSVLRFRMPLMSCKLMQFANQMRVLVGRYPEKEASNTTCLIFSGAYVL